MQLFNQVHSIASGNNQIDTSVWHHCSQCGQSATPSTPLFEFVCFVNLGKRKPQVKEAKFYAHKTCIQVNEDHSGLPK